MEKKKPILPPLAFSWQVHGVCAPKPAELASDLIPVQEEISELNWRNRPRRKQPKNIAANEKRSLFGRPIDVTTAVKLIKDGYNHTKKRLHLDTEQALKLNYGITFDKALILKILSQPNCKGLRSYLCYNEDSKKPHYSLVMLGVDKHGYDLNYYKKEGIAAESQLENRGLLVEYGHPPDKQISFDDPPSFDDHYVVLNYIKK